jgi:hypothetical protein
MMTSTLADPGTARRRSARDAGEAAQTQIDTRALEAAIEARQMARDARDSCRQEYDGLRAELAAHRSETNQRFDRQDGERTRMHEENQRKFDRLFRALWIGAGVIGAVSTLASPIGAALLKLLHP